MRRVLEIREQAAEDFARNCNMCGDRGADKLLEYGFGVGGHGMSTYVVATCRACRLALEKVLREDREADAIPPRGPGLRPRRWSDAP